jgi:leucyl/phenylalanyl-tRNA---protein transferase
MPIFELSKDLLFPPTHLASKDGILAVGGDLNSDRLLMAYSLGIFPWPHEGYPLLWFCPDPRFVLKPTEALIGKSLRKIIRQSPYRITCDTAFGNVMEHCSSSYRPGQEGTWITPEMVNAYTKLHEQGFAHSIEAFSDNQLVGGLYGVSLGGVFFGESMFALQPNASKIAFAILIAHLIHWNFDLVDCQSQSDHLARFGAIHTSRTQFLKLLKESLKTKKTRLGKWNLTLDLLKTLEILKPCTV